MNIKYIIDFIEQYRYTKNSEGKTDEMITFLRKNEKNEVNTNRAIKILASLSGWTFLGMALYAILFKDIVTNKDIIAVVALGFIYLIYNIELLWVKQ